MTRRTFPLLAAALALAVVGPLAPAADVPAAEVPAADAPTVLRAEKEVVSYRAAKWQSAHFADSEKVDRHVATLKKLGCEVKTDPHGGHTDVSHRCPTWMELAFNDHETAHAWETWLKANGFETSHSH
ncbi:hypothetical protein LzC2_42810 [Planctomycetes bacterium LzC2]|uniref:Uncharacterized protein n=2 Tax=Alienimonas chondri TaxID=2681879 RepID=A0ABX1VJ59_9PLAN|nr:hypothetical protein [Alienimonas chondri]